MENKKKLTKSVVDKLTTGDDGERCDYWDTELKGFGCRVSKNRKEYRKVYFVMHRVNGKLIRVTLGKHGVITTDEARKKAIKALAELGDGIDVNAEKAKARKRGKTLQDVLDDYFATKELKPNTVLDYGKVLRLYANDWLNQPIAHIMPDDISKRHTKVAKTVGAVPANKVGRYVRLLFNFAKANKYIETEENPVCILSANKQWRTEPQRNTLIKAADLPRWYNAVMSLKQPITQTALLLMLFAGLRKNEAMGLKWEDVDFNNGLFVVTDTKNKRPHTLIMSDYIRWLFERALSWRQNGYVFPGSGKTGHLCEPRRQLESIERKLGLKIGNHDLRRTFCTLAETVCSYSEVKVLMNHATPNGDVTARYIEIEAGYRAEPAMIRVSNAIMLAARAWCPYQPAERKINKIVDLGEARRRKAA